MEYAVANESVQDTVTSSRSAAGVFDGLLKTDEKAFELQPFCREIIKECSHDMHRAQALLLRRLQMQHPTFYAERVQEAMRYWATESLRKAGNSIRTNLAAQRSNPLTAESMRSLAIEWMDWPVVPGVPLRDATAAHLQRAIHTYRRDSKIMSSRAKWLEAIAGKLPDTSAKVSTILNEEAVALLAAQFHVAS